MSAIVKPLREQQISLDQLAERWVAARIEETAANQRRLAIEQAILAICPAKEEGSETTRLASGAKLVVTGKLSLKVDLPLLVELAQYLPQELRPLKIETVADERGLKYLRANMPDAWRQIAAAVEVKAAKPSISVKAA